MNHIPPLDYIIGLGIIGTVTSLMEMNEVLRMLILLGTFIGIAVKLYEQVKNSSHFYNDVKALWKWIKKK